MKKFQILILFLILTAFSIMLLPLAGWLQNLFYDTAMVHPSTGTADTDFSDQIAIVAIDDPSFAELNRRWPWSREWLAEVIKNLSNDGAEVIGVDISLSEKGFNDREDLVLKEALKENGPVVLISRFSQREERTVLEEPVPILAEVSASGYGNLIPDSDSVSGITIISTEFRNSRKCLFRHSPISFIWKAARASLQPLLAGPLS